MIHKCPYCKAEIQVEVSTTASESSRRAEAKKGINNKTGFRGVCANKGGYDAVFKYHGKRIYVGWFKTKEEASNAYEEARNKIINGQNLIE